MKLIALTLLALLMMLQYGIWLNDGGIPEVLDLQREVQRVTGNMEVLQERNQSLQAEVEDLKTGLDAIEERARSELGMIRQGETYYQIIGSNNDEAEPTLRSDAGE